MELSLGRMSMLPGWGSQCTKPCWYIIVAKIYNKLMATFFESMPNYSILFFWLILTPDINYMTSSRFDDNSL
jgi:hypothetical protein